MEENRDPFKDPNLKATPQGLTVDEFMRYCREREKRDPRYRKGGSRYKERGE